MSTNGFVLQRLLADTRNLAKVRVLEPIGVESHALGYQFESFDSDSGAAFLEIYGQPGDWVIFVEDGRLETDGKEIADFQLESAVWGVMAYGVTEFRRYGIRYWVINSETALSGASRPRLAKRLQSKRPIHEGARELLPDYISIDDIDRLRFYV